MRQLFDPLVEAYPKVAELILPLIPSPILIVEKQVSGVKLVWVR